MDEGAGKATYEDEHDELRCALIVAAQVVEDVFGEHEAGGRKTRIHDAIENRTNAVPPRDDDDQDPQPLKRLFDEGRDEGRSHRACSGSIADREGNVGFQHRIDNARGERRNPRSPQEQSPLGLPGFGFPTVDEEEESADNQEREDGQQRRLGEREEPGRGWVEHEDDEPDHPEDSEDGHDDLENREGPRRLRGLPHRRGIVGGGRGDTIRRVDTGAADLAQPVVFSRPAPVARIHVSIPVRPCACRRQSQWAQVWARAPRAGAILPFVWNAELERPQRRRCGRCE